MHWIAPSEKDTDNAALEKRLWDTADQFRANSGLKAQEYSGPILGIIFLRFAEVRFAKHRLKLENPAPAPAVDHGWMNPPRITPKASSTSRPMPGSISC